MNPRIIDEMGFVVIGIAARTSNAREVTTAGIIGKQWGRFLQDNLMEQIPNKTDSSIVAVYTDYAGDRDGEYIFVIGAQVRSTGEVPAGMVAKTVPAGRYAVFTSPKGPVEKVVVETWQQIWSTPTSALGGDRTFQADFEIYDERAADPTSAQVEVHVGIREGKS
jgi:predicted transcriptional regulator YdeE